MAANKRSRTPSKRPGNSSFWQFESFHWEKGNGGDPRVTRKGKWHNRNTKSDSKSHCTQRLWDNLSDKTCPIPKLSEQNETKLISPSFVYSANVFFSPTLKPVVVVATKSSSPWLAILGSIQGWCIWAEEDEGADRVRSKYICRLYVW